MAFASTQGYAVTLPCSIDILKNASAKPLPPGRHLLRVHPGRGVFETLDIEEFQETKDLVRRVYRRSVHPGLPPDTLQTKTPLGTLRHFLQIVPIVRFATEYYRDRRHWPETFIDKIWSGSWTYLNDTVYMEVLNGPERDRVATMRFVMAPFSIHNGWKVARGATVRQYYGAEFSDFREPDEKQPDSELPKPPRRLPAAAYLGIDFRPVTWRGVGIEWEAGANAIKTGLSPQLHAQAQMLQYLQYLELGHEGLDPMLNLLGTQYLTFGDKISDRLYLPLGYRPVLEFFTETEWVVQEKGPVVFHKDGIDWTAYSQSPVVAAETAVGVNARLTEENGKSFLGQRLVRDAEKMGGRPGLTIPAADLLVRGLSSDDADERASAVSAIYDLGMMQMTNIDSLKNAGPPSRIADIQPALALNIKVTKFLDAVVDKLKQMRQSPNVADRMTVSRAAAALAAVPNKRNMWLKDRSIFTDFVCPLLVDEDESVAQHTYRWVKFIYRPEAIVGILGDQKLAETPQDFLNIRGHGETVRKLRELAKGDVGVAKALLALKARSDIEREASVYE